MIREMRVVANNRAYRIGELERTDIQPNAAAIHAISNPDLADADYSSKAIKREVRRTAEDLSSLVMTGGRCVIAKSLDLVTAQEGSVEGLAVTQFRKSRGEYAELKSSWLCLNQLVTADPENLELKAILLHQVLENVTPEHRKLAIELEVSSEQSAHRLAEWLRQRTESVARILPHIDGPLIDSYGLVKVTDTQVGRVRDAIARSARGFNPEIGAQLS